MIYIALTGISRHVLKELSKNRIRTLEIRSPNNFFALLSVQAGDRIFLTDCSSSDIVPGTVGLIASIRALQTITHRTIESSRDYYEERESQAARVQLQLVAAGRVRKITNFEPGTPLMLDVDEVRYCDAR
ncbi:MAG TPA: DUF473 domain-containing protein [Methanothrix sp.]|jgi:hypothetical protein|nr:DUF473 domain-containing protein [Methanothrix sp.]HOV82077.1 DUF473 domain-containing protein [Methanothrix sp.]HPC90455.1 DUF473 domain-containing protein [Methanothrix sp.]HQE88177.1 DUF473 domain-containing protein [Methanothrix sp.]HQI67714.1 DUF473 domain-containing protein [Methanothrix sp.]